jgi:hypothetical protein
MRRFAALLAIVVCLVDACAAPEPTATPPTSTPSRLTSPAESAPASTDAAGGWRRVALDGGGRPGLLSDVIVFDGQFFAAGSGGLAGEVGVVLRSANGMDWTAEAIPGTRASPSMLAAVGSRLVAVGGGGAVRCAHPYAMDTWARAADGTWAEAPWNDMFCSDLESGSFLNRDGHPALIGVGFGEVALSWASDDGLRWRDLHPAFGELYPRAAVVDGDAILVFGTGADGAPMAGRSQDGRAFTASRFLGLPGSASLLGAFVSTGPLDVFVGDGLALGRARRDAAGGWTLDPADGIRADEIASIRTVGGRYVALGSDENSVPLAWSSPDGLSWSPLALPRPDADTAWQGVAVLGDVAVVVGQADAPLGAGGTVGAIWVGSAALLAS